MTSEKKGRTRECRLGPEQLDATVRAGSPTGRRCSWASGTVEFTEAITFEERDGKTLVTIKVTDLELEEDRDAFMSGLPGYLDALERVVASRTAGS